MNNPTDNWEKNIRSILSQQHVDEEWRVAELMAMLRMETKAAVAECYAVNSPSEKMLQEAEQKGRDNAVDVIKATSVSADKKKGLLYVLEESLEMARNNHS